MSGFLGNLPRLALIEILLGQALSAATVLWNEVASSKCADDAEELVDLIVAANVQLDTLQRCLRKK